MALSILYHGTDIESARDICENGIDVGRGTPHTDFGRGFYTTEDYERAVKWAYRKARVRHSKPAVITLYFDVESAKSFIEFFSDDLRWGQFIINNRNGLSYIKEVPIKENNLDNRYEITMGRIADIDIINVAEELHKSCELLDSVHRILNKKYPLQIAFHTTRSTQYIKKMSYRSV